MAGTGSESVIDLTETMINRDPPEHERLRGVVGEYFQSGYLRQFSDTFEQLAHNQLDTVLGNGTEFDFAASFAAPIPATVIGDVLGVPREKRGLLISVGPGGERAFRELKVYITELIDERKANPTDDILSEVIHAKPAGEDLTNEEIYNFCSLLLLAGSHTTISLLTNAIWTFVENDLITDIRTGTVNLTQAIEEVLRYRPPVHALSRTATEDVELQERTIREGDNVIAWLGSANRDPRQFDEPETFDPERKPNRHISFGSGVHFCLGAQLARLEARTVLPVFFDRVSEVRIATDELDPIMEPSLNGLRSLPISVRT